MESKTRKLVITALLVIFIFVSFMGLAPKFSNPETYAETISVLDEKSSNVLALATSSAAISTGLTMLPGDTASPLADQLADLSSTMMIILCAIFLEKYMLTLTGFAAFKILLPFAAVLWILYMYINKETFKVVATKIVVLAVCLFLIVPVSTGITSFLDDTYDVSIETKLEEAENVANIINENTSEDENVAEKLLSKLTGGVSGILEKTKAVFRSFIEITALMIVTSCVIPILTFAVMIWLMNLVLGLNIQIKKNKNDVMLK